MSEATPYRTAAEVPKDKTECGTPLRVEVGSGVIMRSIPCPTPGAWFRFWNGVKEGEVWRCERCGQHYVWCWYNSAWNWKKAYPGKTSG